MNPVKFIRKLGKALRGGSTFREMFLGVLLGFAVGMIPGVNLTLVTLILLLLFLNTNGALAAIGIMAGKILCLLLAPVTFQIGYAMIHSLGLVGMVRFFADTPVLALLDLHIYCLLGAIPLIVILGVPLAWGISRGIIKSRDRLASATAGNEKMRKAAENKFTRFMMRIVFGKQKETFAEMADKAKSPLILKGRVIAAASVLGLLIVGQLVFLDSLAASGMVRAIAAANGAEVNVANADLSLFSGRLVIEGLEVTDAARPTHNQLQATKIVADISISDLLARRFVAEKIVIEGMQTDVERSSPGEVYRAKEKEEDPVGGLLSKFSKSAEYAKEIKRFNDRLQKLKAHLKSEDSATAEPDKDDLAAQAKAQGYLRLSAKDSLTKHPIWVIREIRISPIELRPGLPTFTAEGKNLSSHPSLYEGEMDKADPEALKAFVAKAAGEKSSLVSKILGGDKDEPSAEVKIESSGETKKKGFLDKILGK